MTLLSNYSLSFQLAGLGQRCVAAIVDGLVLNLVVIIMIYLAGVDASSPQEGPRVLVFWIMLPWFYFTAMESSSKQGTLGKIMMNIQVTDTDGKRVSFGRAGVRTIIKMFTFGLGFLVALFTVRRQAVHDQISGSLVIIKTE